MENSRYRQTPPRWFSSGHMQDGDAFVGSADIEDVPVKNANARITFRIVLAILIGLILGLVVFYAENYFDNGTLFPTPIK